LIGGPARWQGRGARGPGLQVINLVVTSEHRRQTPFRWPMSFRTSRRLCLRSLRGSWHDLLNGLQPTTWFTARLRASAATDSSWFEAVT
jgi:hypothetical protein